MWSIEVTVIIFRLIVLLMVIISATNLYLLKHHILDVPKPVKSYRSTLLYYAGVIYGHGLGCICFRLIRAKKNGKRCHLVCHTMVLITMYAGTLRAQKAYRDKGFEFTFWRHGFTLFTISALVMVYLLAIFFVIFGWGETALRRARNRGLHASTAVMAYLLCICSGFTESEYMMFFSKSIDQTSAKCALILFIIYIGLQFFLMLNPNFDWRRMNTMLRKRAQAKRQLRRRRRQCSDAVAPGRSIRRRR